MGGNKYAHPISAPLTRGNSRVEECPTPLKETGPEPETCVEPASVAEDQTAKVSTFAATHNTLHLTPLAPPTGGEPIGRGTHVSSSGYARPGSMGESPVTRLSLACPTSRPGSRVGPR
ncbi:hypothetical protein CRENBAI_003066 [Crenichthys baileyi]|uniref:Uncharacterized protein n=1 Tax=Crenichthys baileyi TaxID=28760 RepID=A0AAV9S5L5_9TELE